jgi:hypothetical protein
VVLLVLGARPSSAQQQVGPGRCVNCHSSLAKTSWEQKHRGSARQLDEPKAARFAAATGGNARDARCVACHAPTTAGADKGVGCESCHGPGSLYRTPHQQAAFYQKPEGQWLGLANLQGNADRIATLCIGCHVLDPQKDAAIAAAGHPTGAGYAALGKKLDEMKHWPSNDEDAPLSRRRAYDAAFLARVTAAASGTIGARVAKLPKPTGGTAPSPSPGGGVAGRATPPAKPSAAGDVDPFFADEVPEYVPGTAPAVASTPRLVRTLAPDAPPVEIARAPIAPEATVAPAPVPGDTPTASARGPVAPASGPPADVAELRGRAVKAARQLLKDAAGTLTLAKPSAPDAFEGPDGELLRLQDEALELALDTLRKNP